MNKIILTLLIVLPGLGARAQFFVPHLGVTQTHNTQSIHSSSSNAIFNAKSGTGFMFGIGYSAKMGEHLSFQPEVYYLQRSFSLKYTDSVNVSTGNTPSYNVLNSSDTYHIGYLEIPLLFKYTFLKGKMFATFGPYISVGLGGGHSFEYVKTFPGQPSNTNTGSDNIKFGSAPSGANSNNSFDRRTDLGVQPGLGIVVFKKVIFECRWDVGSKNLLKSRSSRNETLVFMLSYPLNIIPEDE